MGFFSSKTSPTPEPRSESDHRFFELRQSGYRGWIDQDGRPADCPLCGQPGCTRDLTAHR